MTVKLSHERKVRSLAKKTLGSTRVGRAMRLPGVVSNCVQYEVSGMTHPGQSEGEVGST